MATTTSRGLLKFSTRMNKIAAGVEKNDEKMMKGVYLAGGRFLVTRTPVKTGLHRSSWIAALGAPSTKIIDSVSKINVPRGLSQVLSAFKLGRKVFFSNSGPAIELLDNGSSDQAPSGFTRGALVVMRTIVRRTKLLRGV